MDIICYSLGGFISILAQLMKNNLYRCDLQYYYNCAFFIDHANFTSSFISSLTTNK